MMNVDTFVYLIALRRDGKFVAPVKVGVSVSPRARLDQLQTASPYELGLVGMLLYPSREIAMQMEDCFHQTHKGHRLRGEWFNIEPGEALSVLRLHARFGLSMFTTMSDSDQELAITLIEQHLPSFEAANG